MRGISMIRRRILFICLLFVAMCSCAAPSEKSMLDLYGVRSSETAFRAPHMRTQLPALLDDEEFTGSDEALSRERVHSREMGAAGRIFVRLFLSALLAGLSALFAYLFAGIYHGSTCPTYGLLRTITFIFLSDGQKQRTLFSH